MGRGIPRKSLEARTVTCRRAIWGDCPSATKGRLATRTVKLPRPGWILRAVGNPEMRYLVAPDC